MEDRVKCLLRVYIADAHMPFALVFWDSWFGLLSPFLVGILPVHLLEFFPVWSEERSCLCVRREQLFCNWHTVLWKWNKSEERPFLWPLTSFARHILCILSSTVFPSALNSSAGTSSGPVTLRLAIWWMECTTSDRSGGGSCPQCSCSIPFHPHHGTSLHNTLSTCLRLVQLQSDFRQSLTGYIVDVAETFESLIWLWKSCLEFPFAFAASSSMYMPSSCCCLSTLSFLSTSAFSSWYQSLSLPFASLFSLVAVIVSSDIHCFLLWLCRSNCVLGHFQQTILLPFHRFSGVTTSCAASNAVNLLISIAVLCCFLFLELVAN